MNPTHAELRAVIDSELMAALDRGAVRIPDAAFLIEELRRLVSAGGKRLRPAFCYWGFRAAGGSHGPAIVRAAASLELLHTFAVVHDDIMDDSSQRRGAATANALHGTSVALLAGDLALVLADAELMEAGFSPAETAHAFTSYSRMRHEVIAGQFLELRFSERQDVTEDEARRIAILKSGRYSVQEPLLIGALLAGGSNELIEDLASVGDCLGEAFQLADDLLGTFGDVASTGKPVDADIRSGKRNVLYAKTLALLEGAERQAFVEGWGGGARLTDEEVARLRGLIESAGARADTERLLDELGSTARARIAALDVDPAARAALLDLAEGAVDRIA